MAVWYMVIIIMVGPTPLSIDISHREYKDYTSCRAGMIAMTNALNEKRHLLNRLTTDRELPAESLSEFRYHLYCEER